MRVINNTDQSISRLLVLYNAELKLVKHLEIESIVFDSCKLTVWGVDRLILEVDENKSTMFQVYKDLGNGIGSYCALDYFIKYGY